MRYSSGECGLVMAFSALVLGALVAAGPLRQADEEALLRREAVDRLQRLAAVVASSTRCRPASVPPRSATSSPSVSLPLILMSSTTVYCEYWSTMQSARLSNFVGVLLGPPVLQIALGVELAAFVVEAVGQFVADGAAGVAVVRRVVHLRIEERRLQHAGREVDVVHLRVVVGVHGRRRHAPFAAVDAACRSWPAARCDSNVGGALDVAEEIVRARSRARCSRATCRDSRSCWRWRAASPAPAVLVSGLIQSSCSMSVFHRLFDLLASCQRVRSSVRRRRSSRRTPGPAPRPGR